MWGIANFAITFLTPVMFNNLSYFIFLVFAATMPPSPVVFDNTLNPTASFDVQTGIHKCLLASVARELN